MKDPRPLDTDEIRRVSAHFEDMLLFASWRGSHATNSKIQSMLMVVVSATLPWLYPVFVGE